MPSILGPLLFLALPAPQQAITLQLADGEFGSTTSAPEQPYLGLRVGAAQAFNVRGPAGAPAWLVASPTPPVPLPFGAGTLAVDPATAFVVAAGLLDAVGELTVPLDVPAGLPLGLPYWSQAIAFDPVVGDLVTSIGLTHATTDAALEVIAAGDKTAHPLKQSFEGLQVVRSQAEWDVFWILHQPTGLPQPTVDFTDRVVIASFAGQVPSTGYALRIDALEPTGGGLRIVRTFEQPGLGCGVLFSQRNPFAFVAVDRVADGASVETVTTTTFGSPCP